MAQKRMFDKRVVDTDKFADLPHSSKALYFLAGMTADDKGFFQPRKLKLMYGFSDDDYKILIAKGYFITFDSGIMVITDWNKNNWLDKRRVQETEYVEELKMLKLINEKYEFKDTAKHLLSENRIEENNIEENNINNNNNIYEFIEKEFGRTLSPIEFEKINKWLLLFDEDIIKYAIELSVMQNKKTFAYINGILKNWKSCGYKTLEEIKENEKSKIKSNEPSWFNEEVKNEEVLLTEEEMKELEEIRRGI